MKKQQDNVKEFHLAFDQPVAILPTVMGAGRRVERGNLLMEEVNEFIGANTMVAQAKEIADVLYVALGTAVELGVDISYIFDAVHTSNMDKLWPDGKVHRRVEDGKVLKPPGHEQPYVFIEWFIGADKLRIKMMGIRLCALFDEQNFILNTPYILREMAKFERCRQKDVKEYLRYVYENNKKEYEFVFTDKGYLHTDSKTRLVHYLEIDGKWVKGIIHHGGNNG